MKKIYSFIILSVFLASVQAQTKSEIKANKYFEKYSYDKAIKRYTDEEELSTESLRKLAISYKNQNMYTEAEETYAKLVETPDATADDIYNYVLMLKAKAKYDEAATWMDKLSEKSANDLRVKDYQSTKADFDSLKSVNEEYKLRNLAMNSDYDDFGAVYYNRKQMAYTSNNPSVRILTRIYNWTNQPFFDIKVATLDTTEFKKTKLLARNVKQKWHEGPASFCRSGKLMAYTQNNYEGKSEEDIVKLQIFFAEYKRHKWEDPVPFELNSNEYSVGHPAFNSRGDVLFFVSDMPGGYGGTDIYFVKKEGKNKWSEPVNLGDKINTEGNEMFPYYESRHGLLFFSSNGRNGLGGLDVYVAVKTPTGFDQVENLGAPVNTQWDDFSFIADKKLKEGYFSSNREGGKGGDDIYYYTFAGKYPEYVPVDSIHDYLYQLYVYNDETKNPISKAKVMLDIVPTETNEQGMVSGRFKADESFDASIHVVGYVDKTHHVEIGHSQESATIKDTVYLAVNKDKQIKLENIYYAFDKAEILPESAEELDKLVNFMQDNPQLKVELSSHTDCRGSDKYNLILSDKRAKSAVDYILSKGVDEDRIVAKGYGETRPVNQCVNGVRCTREEHQQNRRTEIRIQDKDKK